MRPFLLLLIFLILNPVGNLYCTIKLDVPFAYDFNGLVSNDLEHTLWIKEEFLEPITSYKTHIKETTVYQPQFQLPKSLFHSEGTQSLLEATPIKGTKPKIVYRNEYFLRSHYMGKWYTTPSSYILFGGSRPVYWRSNPRDMGVFIGQGVEF